MPKKRRKEKARKTIHYVQLRTHRQWPNELTYLSHLDVYNSKIKPITYDIDRLLNNKWINIRQPQLITELNHIHQQEIKNSFLHKVNQQNIKLVTDFILDKFN
jgi:hypothetical protein